jgi:pyruvate dehydrogenase E2 component (dihydrolipoamide acetyltransferase)
MAEKELRLPRMGETMNEGMIVAWLKQPGEHFRRGETLLEVESDKTNVEIPALEDGEMVLHLALAGEKVAVDHPIAVVQTFDSSSPSSKSAESQLTVHANVAPEAKIQRNEYLWAPVAEAKIRASPAARRMAREEGVNLPEIKGTGPRGRVTTRDIRRHASLSAKPASSTVAESSGQALRWGTPQSGTCVLLHGFAGDPTTWRRTGEFLAEQGFEAIALELPGHGLLPLVGPSLDELAAEVTSRLRGAPNGKYHLIGHSLGGAVAILIAARDPRRVASLTLLAPIGIGTYINQPFLDGIVSAGTIEALERELRKTTARPLSYAKSALAAILENRRSDALKAISQMMALDGVQQLFLVPELEKITAPVRVFFGRQDKILHWQDALSLPGKIALHLFDTGHMPHWEDPSVVLPVLGRFPVGS